MAVLSTTARKRLPKSDFAVPSKEPGSGSYPIPDIAHIGAARARAKQFGGPGVQAAVERKIAQKFPSHAKRKG